MDTDWCLTCSVHIEDPSSPYCSFQCRHSAGPSQLHHHHHHSSSDDLIYHVVVDTHYDAIVAWAASIPAGPPSQDTTPLPQTATPRSSKPSSLRSSRSSNASPTSVATVVYRPPELIRPHRPIPAALCMSTPHTVPSSPSRPITTPQQHIAAYSATHSASTMSTGHTSIESSLATPASSKALPFSPAHRKSSSSVLVSMTSHVRSWVQPSSLISKDPDAIYVALPPTSTTTRSSFSKLPLPPDEHHPSYRARGRKASRAVA